TEAGIRVFHVTGVQTCALAFSISVDTTLAAVARAALDAGANAINDVSAGTEAPEILRLAAERSAGLILMHRLTTPDRDSYSDQRSEERRVERVGRSREYRRHAR